MEEPKRLVIIGGGFAGVWAAMAAAEVVADGPPSDRIEIELINPRDVLVLRPRLYEADPGSMTVPLHDVLNPISVAHLRAMATEVDVDASTVTVVDEHGRATARGFDRLILATGSQLVRPPAELGPVYDIDTIETAVALDGHLASLGPHSTVVIVGAGFTGIELATELTGRMPDARIVLVERDAHVGPELGAGPRPTIQAALDDLGVETRTGVAVEFFDGHVVRLGDGSSIDTDTVVWTAGMVASELTAQLPGERDRLGRLTVDQQLRLPGAPHVFVAGDTAAPLDESGHVVIQSCQHAMPQGTCAGHNAIADMVGRPLSDLATIPYRTCLDLGPAGAVYSEGWDRTVLRTGAEAKAIKQYINTQRILPSADAAAGPAGVGAA